MAPRPVAVLVEGTVSVLVRGMRVKVLVLTGRFGKIEVFAASRYQGPIM